MSRIHQTLVIASICAALAPATVLASGDHHQKHGEKKAESKSAAPTPEMTAAEVKKVDRDAKKITLKHEAIKHLDMPAMTMVFQVKDDKLLDAAKPGDKVRVQVEQVKGGYAVTAIEGAK